MPILFLIIFVDLVGFGLIIPLLPFYAVRFAASPLQMTMLFATYSLMSMLTAPLWGGLSDRIGRRPVLMASMADRKSTRLNSSHIQKSRMPSSA